MDSVHDRFVSGSCDCDPCGRKLITVRPIVRASRVQVFFHTRSHTCLRASILWHYPITHARAPSRGRVKVISRNGRYLHSSSFRNIFMLACEQLTRTYRDGTKRSTVPAQESIMNITSSYNVTFERSPVWVTYATSFTLWCTLCMILSVASSSAAVILLWAIFQRKVQCGSKILMINLMSTELIISAILLPAMALTVYVPKFRLGITDCSFFYFVLLWVPYSAQWSAFFLAVNRANAILFPHRYGQWKSRSFVVPIIVLGWLLTFCGMCGYIGHIVVSSPWPSCDVRFPPLGQRFNLPLFLTSILFYMPLAGTFFSYFLVVLHELYSRYFPAKIDVTESRPENLRLSKLRKSRSAAANVLFAGSLMSLGFFLPYSLRLTLFASKFAEYPPLTLWMRLMYYAGYTGNSIVILTLSKEYRGAVRKMWEKFRPSAAEVGPDQKEKESSRTNALYTKTAHSHAQS